MAADTIILRNPSTVFQQLLNELPNNIAEKLQEKAAFWSLEVFWSKLTDFINVNIGPNSKDEESIRIYSILCGMSYDEMRECMIANGD